MKIFHKKDGGIVQLIDINKMKEWPIELPLIFIEYIRNNQLKTYSDTKVQKEIETYLDEILRDVAIPRLIEVLDGNNHEEIITALIRIEDLAKKKIGLVEPIKPYLGNLENNKNKEINKLCKSIVELFAKEEKKKKLADQRKIMRQKEKDFLIGKINGEEYAKARREYLTLKD